MSERQKVQISAVHTRQTGAALLVSLIILLILSVIGISAMRGGLLQALMAANSQQAEMAFSVADAGVSAMMYVTNQEGVGAGGILANATVAGRDVITPYEVDSVGAVLPAGSAPYFDAGRGTPITTVAADIIYRDCVQICPGYSINKANPNVGCHIFEINSRGAVAGTQTQVDQWVRAASTKCPE